MLEIVASIVGGAVLGGIISAWISRHYARKSSAELHEVSEELYRRNLRGTRDLLWLMIPKEDDVAHFRYHDAMGDRIDVEFTRGPVDAEVEFTGGAYGEGGKVDWPPEDWPPGDWTVKYGEFSAKTNDMGVMQAIVTALHFGEDPTPAAEEAAEQAALPERFVEINDPDKEKEEDDEGR